MHAVDGQQGQEDEQPVRQFDLAQASQGEFGAAALEVEVEECDLPVEELIEINALMARNSSSRRFIPRGGAPRRQQGPNNRQRPAPRFIPPRGDGSALGPLCANCHQRGHRAAECKQPKKAMQDRECFNCNGKGHLAKDCPMPKRGPIKAIMDGPTSVNTVMEQPRTILMVDAEGFSQRRRPQPRPFSVADFVLKNAAPKPVAPGGVGGKGNRNRFRPLAASDLTDDDEGGTAETTATNATNTSHTTTTNTSHATTTTSNTTKKIQNDEKSKKPKVTTRDSSLDRISTSVSMAQADRTDDSTPPRPHSTTTPPMPAHAPTTPHDTYDSLRRTPQTPQFILLKPVDEKNKAEKEINVAARWIKSKSTKASVPKHVQATVVGSAKGGNAEPVAVLPCDRDDWSELDPDDDPDFAGLVDSSDDGGEQGEGEEPEEYNDETHRVVQDIFEASQRMERNDPRKTEKNEPMNDIFQNLDPVILRDIIRIKFGDVLGDMVTTTTRDELEQRTTTTDHDTKDVTHGVLRPQVCVIEGQAGEGEVLGINDEWVDLEFEVALDSGSIVHIASECDTPGYSIVKPGNATRHQNFIVGDGGILPNQGEKELNLASEQGEFGCTFQIAKVTRPLMSAGLICDKGFRIVMEDTFASVIRKSDGVEVLRFVRKHGGLYLARLRLKAPFGRRG